MRTTLLIAVCAVAFAALAGVRAEEETADSDVLVVTDATMNKVLEANANSGVLLVAKKMLTTASAISQHSAV